MIDTNTDQIKDNNEAEQKHLSVVARIMTAALQKLIEYDPNAVKKLKTSAGKKVKINLEPVNLSMVLVIEADNLYVSSDSSLTVDTTISGKPSALFAMSTNQHIPGLDGVSINGDATTGQFVADFLKQLEPDWEDAWCDLLGEGPGYQVSKIMQGLKQAGSGFINSMRMSTHDYLTEESRELVSPDEMEQFLDQVDDLQADAVRIERKLAQIMASNKP